MQSLNAVEQVIGEGQGIVLLVTLAAWAHNACTPCFVVTTRSSRNPDDWLRPLWTWAAHAEQDASNASPADEGNR